MSKNERHERLMPNGEPRWVRCYDNGGETTDRYTVLFVGKRGGFGVHMSTFPFHPQGVGMTFEFNGWDAPDRIGNSWAGPSIGRKSVFGVRIPFASLPPDCRRLVVGDYVDTWGL